MHEGCIYTLYRLNSVLGSNAFRVAAGGSSFRGALQRCDVDLVHFYHRFHQALRFGFIFIDEQFHEDHRRRRYAYLFAPHKRTISSRRPYFSTLGAILLLYICHRFNIRLPHVQPPLAQINVDLAEVSTDSSQRQRQFRGPEHRFGGPHRRSLSRSLPGGKASNFSALLSLLSTIWAVKAPTN